MQPHSIREYPGINQHHHITTRNYHPHGLVTLG